jgi:hypothetical protein
MIGHLKNIRESADGRWHPARRDRFVMVVQSPLVGFASCSCCRHQRGLCFHALDVELSASVLTPG